MTSFCHLLFVLQSRQYIDIHQQAVSVYRRSTHNYGDVQHTGDSDELLKPTGGYVCLHKDLTGYCSLQEIPMSPLLKSQPNNDIQTTDAK